VSLVDHVDNTTFTLRVQAEPVTGSANTISVDLPTGLFRDAAGNALADGQSFSVEFGNIAPTAAFTSSAPSPTGVSPIPVTLTFTEVFGQEVSGFDANDIQTNQHVAAVEVTGRTGNVIVLAVTPDGNGPFDLELSLPEGSVIDVAGNENQATGTFTIAYDNVPPTVAIMADSVVEHDGEYFTNADPISVTVTFSKPVWGFEADAVEVQGAALSGFIGSDGDTIYSLELNPTNDGLITIGVAADAARDAAGNGSEVAEPLTINSDRTAPWVVSVEPEAGITDPTNERSFGIVITFSEDIASFDHEALEVTNGTVSSATAQDGRTVVVTIEPSADGQVRVVAPDGLATDVAGNHSEASEEAFAITFDGSRPSVALSTETGDPTNAASFEVMITFSKPVVGFSLADLEVVNADLSDFTEIDAETYGVVVVPQNDGLVSLSVRENVAADAAGNGNDAAELFVITYDGTPPVVSFQTDVVDPMRDDTFELTISFSEAVMGFATDGIEVLNGSLKSFLAVDEQTFTADVTVSEIGVVTFSVRADAAFDMAGNGNDAAQFALTYDPIPAPVILVAPADASGSIPLEPELSWKASEGAATYRLQVATDEDFQHRVIEVEALEQPSYRVGQSLDYYTTYFWRVQAVTRLDTGTWSEHARFITEASAPQPQVPDRGRRRNQHCAEPPVEQQSSGFPVRGAHRERSRSRQPRTRALNREHGSEPLRT
jgi:large repetitive protein